jgi:hypothetical protein
MHVTTVDVVAMPDHIDGLVAALRWRSAVAPFAAEQRRRLRPCGLLPAG